MEPDRVAEVWMERQPMKAIRPLGAEEIVRSFQQGQHRILIGFVGDADAPPGERP